MDMQRILPQLTQPTVGVCIPPTWRFTLDGEAVDVSDFLRVNGFGFTDLLDVVALKVGGELHYGGGAAAEFTLRRVADSACTGEVAHG